MSDTTKPDIYAIIVAGGSGMRMQAATPKQFMLMNGLPVLMHTINTFKQSIHKPKIILALPQAYHQYWQELCKDFNFNVPHDITAGGETRFHSVKNALLLIDNDDAMVAVQDAVRPLTTVEIIDNAFAVAAEKGSAVVAVQSRDSVRQLRNGVSKHLHRDDIYLVQTPQTFRSQILKKAYEQPYQPGFTDDASVVEAMGLSITLVAGSYTNIKITYPEDIGLAEVIQKKLPLQAAFDIKS